MSSSQVLPHQNERWEVGDQEWSRDPTSGAFDLVDYRGLGAAPETYSPLDWAGLVGARTSLDEADRGPDGERAVALYPGDFKFSPITGKPLPDPALGDLDPWLPPFGADSLSADSPQGLRLTASRLLLRPSLSLESPPDRELTMPPPGTLQFLGGSFDTCESRLLALDVSIGRIHQWLPHAQRWLELQPSGAETLATSFLGENAWGMAAQNLRGSDKIFLPTDDGLAVVSINLVAGTYEVHTVGHRCVGAPVFWQGSVHVPMLDADARLGIFTLHPQGMSLRRMEGPELSPAAARWVRPLADARRIVWMGSRAQLVVQRQDGAAPEASLISWLPGITPRFDRGSAFLSEDGRLWQQCFRRDEQGGRFVSVQLGVEEPEIRAVGEARPGQLPRPEAIDGVEPGEVVFPLLESTSTSTLLSARVTNQSSVDHAISSTASLDTIFELRGRYDVNFWRSRIPRPWATQAFVYGGHLYLYHPDKRSLPGWRIEP